jgi:valyl-tRNA synthetase
VFDGISWLAIAFLQVRVVGSVEEASSSSSSSNGSNAPSVSVVVREGVQVLLPMAGLFDVDKELARLNKQKQKVSGQMVCLDERAALPVPLHLVRCKT